MVHVITFTIGSLNESISRIYFQRSAYSEIWVRVRVRVIRL